MKRATRQKSKYFRLHVAIEKIFQARANIWLTATVVLFCIAILLLAREVSLNLQYSTASAEGGSGNPAVTLLGRRAGSTDSFRADTLTIERGQSVELKWEGQNVRRCRATPRWTQLQTATIAPVSVGPITEDRTFGVTCWRSVFGKRVRATLIVTPPPADAKGWDPGLRTRRITTMNPGKPTYFEDCPDAPSSRCHGSVLAGDGFYTLSPEIGGTNVPCRVNSDDVFTVPITGQPERCPHNFAWQQGASGNLIASLGTDTLQWSRTDTPNIWLGFQENTPYGDVYLGGKNFPNINDATFEAEFSATVHGIRSAQGAKVRFLTGVAWFVPKLNKSFVLEMNLDSINAASEPAWSTTAEAVDNPACGQAVKCLYLGGRFWQQPSILSVQPTKITIDWAGIAERLVQKGYLPPDALGPYKTTTFHSGPEILGRAAVSMQISKALIKNREASVNPPILTLRDLSAARGIHIGSALAHGPWVREPEYKPLLLREFSAFTLEASSSLHPERDRFNFATHELTQVTNWAQTHGLKVRGPAMVWHHNVPSWVRNGNFSPEELREILETHIKTITGHYRGKVTWWDIVNEQSSPIPEGRYFWNRIGDNYRDLAFRWAHEADPNAKLCINDYGTEWESKADALYLLVSGMKERGVPIHCVGFQMHLNVGGTNTAERIAAIFKRFGDLGLEVHITEMDVRTEAVKGPAGSGVPDSQLARQADIYGTVMRACLAVPACKLFTVWGLADKYSWIRWEDPQNKPLLFDDALNPKPAYHRLIEILRSGP
jgi:endo-1,4-beta-xylanase